MLTIYQIYCKDENIRDIYIGSTLNYHRRKNAHKSGCNNPNSRQYGCIVYQFIRSKGGFENFNFKILNEVENIDKEWNRRREQMYIDLYKPTLNMFKAYNNEEESKLQHLECNKIYREKNREKEVERNTIYYKTNKEIISERRKIYYENNKQKFAEQSKVYYENNKQHKIDYQREYREKMKQRYVT